jgi:hypothetical protein
MLIHCDEMLLSQLSITSKSGKWNILRNITGLEIREYSRRDPSHWPRDTLYPQKLPLTSPTSGGRSVGIVRSLTQATKFSYLVLVRNITAFFFQLLSITNSVILDTLLVSEVYWAGKYE